MPAPPEEQLIRRALDDIRTDAFEADARLALFDTLCCIRAGAGGDGVRPASLEPGAATALALGERVSLADAVASNAAAAHALDLDDLHWATYTHPGSVVWPAVLGVAELTDASVGAALAAAAIGYQVVGRASCLFGPQHRAAYHVTATAGAAGAAAAAAWLVSRDVDVAQRAVNNALATIGGTRQTVAELSDTAMWHRSVAALAGVAAARFRYAEPVHAPLSGPQGLAAACGHPLDVESLGADLLPVISQRTVRRHGVCGFSHAIVDGILDVGTFRPGGVAAVKVQAAPWVVRAHRSPPPTREREALWHLPTVAALAVTGRVETRRVGWPLPRGVSGLAGRVTIDETDQPLGDLAVSGTVTLRGGGTHSWSRDVPDGHPNRPLTADALIERAIAMGAFAESTAEPAFRLVGQSVGRVRTLIDDLLRL